jgi:hypothetical protein
MRSQGISAAQNRIRKSLTALVVSGWLPPPEKLTIEPTSLIVSASKAAKVTPEPSCSAIRLMLLNWPLPHPSSIFSLSSGVRTWCLRMEWNRIEFVA